MVGGPKRKKLDVKKNQETKKKKSSGFGCV